MRLGFATRLFLLAVAVVAVSVLVGSAYLDVALEAQLLRRVEDDLLVRARLVQERVELAPAGKSWDGLADDWAGCASGRVTIIDREGRVLGDSSVDAAGLSAVENHAGRPEVVAAVRDGRGASTRTSDTVHPRMMYVAVPFRRAPASAAWCGSPCR
jgi:two-component system phosphate regulon sensor histidine kinase PhoR